jgi:hypothetical protein
MKNLIETLKWITEQLDIVDNFFQSIKNTMV